ncbi:hypothetical protein FQN57_002983 [Myotisia sp. PD_48]|nr:hypothetical protein FQN57_002983 [Myotisia sp. PD_48]
MALPAHRSLLHPVGTEQLPAYSPRQSLQADPETASLHSNAPSYVSAAPSYHSFLPPRHTTAADHATTTPSNAVQPSTNTTSSFTGQQARQAEQNGVHRVGLPPTPLYARGFENRSGTSSFSGGSSSFRHTMSAQNLRSLYNVSEWVPVTGGLQARHYRNVANRRVADGSSDIESVSRFLFPALFPTISESGPSNPLMEDGPVDPQRPFINSATSPSTQLGPNASTATLVVDETIPRSRTPRNTSPDAATITFNASHSDLELPLNPLEDPDLVGEEAAARFRAQRLYIAAQQDENNGQPNGSQLERTRSQPQDEVPSGRVYQYSSLVSPASTSIVFTPSPEQRQRSRSFPSQSSQPGAREGFHSSVSVIPEQERPRTVINSLVAASPRTRSSTDPYEALRAQESRTWDCMIAQMADLEERERRWKKYKEQVEKQFSLIRHLKIGPNWITWSQTAARRKAAEKKKKNRRVER